MEPNTIDQWLHEGNDIALSWYYALNPDAALPAPPAGLPLTLPAGAAIPTASAGPISMSALPAVGGSQTTTIILIVAVIGVFLLLK